MTRKDYSKEREIEWNRNEMERVEYKIEEVEVEKLKRELYSSLVLKHSCLLELYTELLEEKNNTWAIVFF